MFGPQWVQVEISHFLKKYSWFEVSCISGQVQKNKKKFKKN